MNAIHTTLARTALACAIHLAACTGAETAPESPTVPVSPPAAGEHHDALSEWHLFTDVSHQTPAEGVTPYEVVAPLFTDYAAKSRFLYVPPGSAITYDDAGPWQFPVGSVLVKTFAYPRDPDQPDGELRLVETRLLYLTDEGWQADTYVYDDDQRDAHRKVAGEFVELDAALPSGRTTLDYHVPNAEECKHCHAHDDVVAPLGVRTRQLDRAHDYGEGPEDQLEHLAALGLLDREPQPRAAEGRLVDPFEPSVDLALRARSYLDSNCAHCHSSGGFAAPSGMFLDLGSTAPGVPQSTWGVCKTPPASPSNCGASFDVVPGDADASILLCRMRSTDIAAHMPPLGTTVVHEEAAGLVASWIDSMPAQACNP